MIIFHFSHHFYIYTFSIRMDPWWYGHFQDKISQLSARISFWFLRIRDLHFTFSLSFLSQRMAGRKSFSLFLSIFYALKVTPKKMKFFMFLRIYSCLLKKFLWKTLFLCSEWARYSRSCHTIKSYKETAISSFLPCQRLPILTFILFINKTLVWKLFAENCISSNKWPPKKEKFRICPKQPFLWRKRIASEQAFEVSLETFQTFLFQVIFFKMSRYTQISYFLHWDEMM